MHRFRLFLVVAGITTTMGVAQAQKYSRFTLNVSGGKSLSVRELATQVFGETRGELAGDGVAGQVVATYYPSKRLGIAARFSYNQNKTREEGIKLIASNQYLIIDPTVETADNWNVASAMVGPSLRVGGRWLGLEGRLLVGYASVNSPAFITNGIVQVNNRFFNVKVETESQNAADLAYGAGATLHIGITKGIALVANADASLVSTTFKGVNNQVTTTGFPTQTQQFDIQQNVGVVNVTAGLRFSF